MSNKEAEKPGYETSTVAKCPTGVQGVDELTLGGLPKGRTTLVLGPPGSGKTVLAAEFAVHGAVDFDEPAVIVALGQTEEHLAADLSSVGLELPALCAAGQLAVVPIGPPVDETVETGDYTLDGLFAMIERAVVKIGAKRVVLDDLDALLDQFRDSVVLRREFLRLGGRLAELGMTTVMTRSMGESRDGLHRLEEYLADCVVMMDNRVENQIATRRLRVMKYRGAAHGTDEYPFVITANGLRVFPITSTSLHFPASSEWISTGIPDLDAMLDGNGFHKGSAVLVSGPSGTGKTTLAAQFAASVATAGVRCLYLSFEESPDQIIRNTKSVGLDLAQAIKGGNLLVYSTRPSLQGLEKHLAAISDKVEAHGAEAVVIDPMTNLVSVGSSGEVKAMLTRLLDGFKSRQITVVLTSLIGEGDDSSGADIGISSLMDTILAIESTVQDRCRTRRFSVVKSRGTAHSQMIHELVFSDDGIQLKPPDITNER